MNRRRTLFSTVIAIVAVAGIGAVIWNSGSAPTEMQGSPQARAGGQSAFDANCARCHGPEGTGTNQGPPLVHNIYNPGHHGDRAFRNAARNGVRQHHWRFGNMPPQPQVTASELDVIIGYVRELQRAKGIRYQRHTM